MFELMKGMPFSSVRETTENIEQNLSNLHQPHRSSGSGSSRSGTSSHTPTLPGTPAPQQESLTPEEIAKLQNTVYRYQMDAQNFVISKLAESGIQYGIHYKIEEEAPGKLKVEVTTDNPEVKGMIQRMFKMYNKPVVTQGKIRFNAEDLTIDIPEAEKLKQLQQKQQQTPQQTLQQKQQQTAQAQSLPQTLQPQVVKEVTKGNKTYTLLSNGILLIEDRDIGMTKSIDLTKANLQASVEVEDIFRDLIPPSPFEQRSESLSFSPAQLSQIMGKNIHTSAGVDIPTDALISEKVVITLKDTRTQEVIPKEIAEDLIIQNPENTQQLKPLISHAVEQHLPTLAQRNKSVLQQMQEKVREKARKVRSITLNTMGENIASSFSGKLFPIFHNPVSAFIGSLGSFMYAGSYDLEIPIATDILRYIAENLENIGNMQLAGNQEFKTTRSFLFKAAHSDNPYVLMQALKTKIPEVKPPTTITPEILEEKAAGSLAIGTLLLPEAKAVTGVKYAEALTSASLGGLLGGMYGMEEARSTGKNVAQTQIIGTLSGSIIGSATSFLPIEKAASRLTSFIKQPTLRNAAAYSIAGSTDMALFSTGTQLAVTGKVDLKQLQADIITGGTIGGLVGVLSKAPGLAKAEAKASEVLAPEQVLKRETYLTKKGGFTVELVKTPEGLLKERMIIARRVKGGKQKALLDIYTLERDALPQGSKLPEIAEIREPHVTTNEWRLLKKKQVLRELRNGFVTEKELFSYEYPTGKLEASKTVRGKKFVAEIKSPVKLEGGMLFFPNVGTTVMLKGEIKQGLRVRTAAGKTKVFFTHTKHPDIIPYAWIEIQAKNLMGKRVIKPEVKTAVKEISIPEFLKKKIEYAPTKHKVTFYETGLMYEKYSDMFYHPQPSDLLAGKSRIYVKKEPPLPSIRTTPKIIPEEAKLPSKLPSIEETPLIKPKEKQPRLFKAEEVKTSTKAKSLQLSKTKVRSKPKLKLKKIKAEYEERYLNMPIDEILPSLPKQEAKGRLRILSKIKSLTKTRSTPSILAPLQKPQNLLNLMQQPKAFNLTLNLNRTTALQLNMQRTADMSKLLQQPQPTTKPLTQSLLKLPSLKFSPPKYPEPSSSFFSGMGSAPKKAPEPPQPAIPKGVNIGKKIPEILKKISKKIAFKEKKRVWLY